MTGHGVDERWSYKKAEPTPGKVCVNADSGAHRKRPAPHPGPRCQTCHRKAQRARSARAHETRTLRVYGVTPEQYQALYVAQGGVCFICRRATGKSKRLAVDHDHRCCAGPTSCGRCVRGLLCSTCNRILGHFRDDPAAFHRGQSYLQHPPAHRMPPPEDERAAILARAFEQLR